MNFQLNEYHRDLTDDDLINDLRLVASKNCLKYVSRAQYEKNGKYSATPFLNRWGTWINVLSQAGLATSREPNDYKKISDEELITDIQVVAHTIGKASISTKDYNEYGRYSVQTILGRFETWDVALGLAGLASTSYKVISDEELFSEIERLWIKEGRQPTTTDVKNGKSKYSLNTFLRRFGGWRKALEAFVAYVNATENDSDDSEYQANTTSSNEPCIDEKGPNGLSKNKKRTPRDINLRLRFKVLSRDCFKCCICGASPAKDPSVELHVDHIIPWSRGGETEIENLQTLCSKCNLGKSDLMID